MLKTNVSFFNILTKFVQTFVLSVGKLLNAWCNKTPADCCSCHWRTTDSTSEYDTKCLSS